MQSGPFYRFQKTEVERLSMLKGEDSWYRVSNARNETLYHCHVVGNCLGGTCTFHASREESEVLFRIEPRRKFLNLTYTVSEGESGPRLATLKLSAARGMKAYGSDDLEIFRVVDPQSKLDKFMQDVLDGCCSEYAIVEEDRVIGRFERRERPRAPERARRGVFRRLLGGALQALVRDWCLELEDDGKALADPRPLIAAMLVLQEQSIRLDQST